VVIQPELALLPTPQGDGAVDAAYLLNGPLARPFDEAPRRRPLELVGSV
jgi:hypothetical protein